MKFVSIAAKGIKEIFRDKKGLAFLIVFPMAFMFVFGFAFGSTNSANEPKDIAVLNHDNGTTLYYQNIPEEINFGDNFTNMLKDLKYEDRVTHLFNVHNVSEDKANDMLMKREIACILIIPENFSNAIRAMINETIRTEITSNIDITGFTDFPANYTLPEVENVTAEIVIKGDTGYMEFGRAQSMLIKIFEEYKNEIKRNVEVENYRLPK